jgi:hypothetical protein
MRVGSFFITMGAEGAIKCPLDSKKSKNICLSSCAFILIIILLNENYLNLVCKINLFTLDLSESS